MLCAAVALASVGVLPTFAESSFEGKVIKRKGQSSLYYVSSDGKRYVFPNDKTYHSWYSDFSGIVELDDTQLAQMPLGGNVVYRPGVVLVKIQTDPKVYAVSKGGILRWVKTEELAKKLYGRSWSLLVDDIPDSFFVNYVVGLAIDSESSFDPDDEEVTAATVEENRAAKKAERARKEKTSFCERSQRQLNRIQERLARRGVTINGVGDDFVERCIATATTKPGKDDDDDDDDNDRKVVICHVPPGNPAARSTIIVGKPAAKAHLSHGDKLGRCLGDGNQQDKTAPVITSIATATTTATATNVTWTTNEDSTSKVTYATSSLSLASSTQSVTSSALVKSHGLPLTGLSPATKYYFRVESADAAGNTATSTEMSFTTLSTSDVTPPTISSISATAATSTATVNWTTNESSNSVVKFSTQPLASATSTQTVSSSSMVTAHSLPLTGLQPSTTYYYRVESMDTSANTATSTQRTFVTTALPVVDVTAPIISSIVATPTTTSATIAWSTNEASSSEVIYATGPLASATSTQSVSNVSLVTSHSLSLTSLTASTTYYFLVKSADAAANTASSTQQTFTTIP